MCKLLGKRRKSLTALLSAVVFLAALLTAECNAQMDCPTPTITSVSPDIWVAGKSQDVTISGSGFIVQDPPCIFVNVTVTQPVGSVTGVIDSTSPTEIRLTVTPDAADPPETACISVSSFHVMVIRQAQPADSPVPSDTSGCMATAQIVNGGPTITSVSPSNWFASQTYNNLTITGTGFLTASDSGGPTQLSAGVGQGSVSLSNVTVNSATQITATVSISNDATTGPATLTVSNSGGGSGSGAARFILFRLSPIRANCKTESLP